MKNVLKCTFAIFGILFATVARGEILVGYDFDSAGPDIKAFHPSEVGTYIEARKALGNGYGPDALGNGRIHLGRVADYGDVRANGRAIFHFHGTNKRKIELDWLTFDYKVLASAGLDLDTLQVLVNGISVGNFANLPAGSDSVLLDLRAANISGPCMTLEIRGQDSVDSSMNVLIDNVMLLGNTKYDEKLTNRPCLGRELDLKNIVAFYDFRNLGTPTYVHPLLSGTEVTDANGDFRLGGGGYNEQQGLFSPTAAHLEPGTPTTPNFYTFAIRVLNNAEIQLDSITIRAAGQGARDFLPRKMSVSLNGTKLKEFDIDGVTRGYVVDVNQKFDRFITVDVSIWGDAPTLNGIVDEVLINGKVELDGVQKAVNATLVPD